MIRETKVCQNCLRKHNGTCRHQNVCGVNGCTYLHHPLLHIEQTEAPRSISQADAAEDISCNVHQTKTSDVLFRIVPVVLHGPSKMVYTYAFIDDGSEITLMENSLAQELGLQGMQKALCLKWTGGASRMEDKSQKVQLAISPARNVSKKYQLSDVRTIHELKVRPQTLIASEMQSRFRHLTGISFDSYTEVSPRILIGLDNAHLGYSFKSRKGKQSEPIAVKTRLGWTLYGTCSPSRHFGYHINYHAVQVCKCSESDDQSPLATINSYLSPGSMDGQREMDIVEAETTPKDGRFESGFSVKHGITRRPDSRSMALRKRQHSERQMKKTLADALRSEMVEYIQRGFTLPHFRRSTGVDYFGQIMMSMNRRSKKCWVLKHIRPTIHAIHLPYQSAHTLNTDSRVMALNNVIGRRSTSVAICNHQGTKFRDASKKLKTAVDSLDEERLMKRSTTLNTSWEFDPLVLPYTRRVRELLFLMIMQNAWQLFQTNQFGSQWFHDYLPSITRCTIRPEPTEPIEAEEIVDMTELRWNYRPKVHVIATKPGASGQVIVATLQTTSGINERPAVRLVVLDVSVCKNMPQDGHRRIPGGEC